MAAEWVATRPDFGRPFFALQAYPSASIWLDSAEDVSLRRGSLSVPCRAGVPGRAVGRASRLLTGSLGKIIKVGYRRQGGRRRGMARTCPDGFNRDGDGASRDTRLATGCPPRSIGVLRVRREYRLTIFTNKGTLRIESRCGQGEALDCVQLAAALCRPACWLAVEDE